ncbi:MAG: GH92 family glycosyl hydrolase [Persicimonas sp.]
MSRHTSILVIVAVLLVPMSGCSPAQEQADAGLQDVDASGADGGMDATDAADSVDADTGARLVHAERAFELVDPFIGTGGLGFGYAALTPAAQIPNGLVKLGPDTTRGGSHPDLAHFSGYNFADGDVRGFSHLHLVGTGVPGLGNLGVLPVAEVDAEAPWRQFTAMDKDSEAAEPGYYKVSLPDLDVSAELTATRSGGFHRYSSESDQLTLLFDPASSVKESPSIDADITVDGDIIEGSVVYGGDFATRSRPFALHFSAALDTTPSDVSTWTDEGVEGGSVAAQGTQAGAVLVFDDVQRVELRVGLSLVDLAQARLHREDLDERSFEQVRQAAADSWKQKLGRVRTRGGSLEDQTIFYTALYNIWRMPSRLDGLDGRYRGMDGEVHTADGFAYYSDLSLWDTFRTLHPWLTLVDPEMQADCLNSLLAMKEATGYIPRWPAMLSYTGSMLGTPGDQLFAEGALKQIPGVDYEAAFDALYETATQKPAEGAMFSGRTGIARYIELGYVPADEVDESVSRTLEFAWGDWSLANLADTLGREEADELRQRAGNWQHLYDDEFGILRPRNADGSFVEDISGGYGDRSGHYTEGGPWHWSFYPMWQPEQLATTFGGAEAFYTSLSRFFERSGINSDDFSTALPDRFYWHGNEHDIGSAYLFHFTEHPEEVGRWIRLIQKTAYTTDPDGIPGNDDGGTLSAWYLFSALGFYPVAGGDQYLLGAPLFPYAEVDVADDQTLVIEADGAGPDSAHVVGVHVDGEPVEGPYLSHDQLRGTTLSFEMAGE